MSALGIERITDDEGPALGVSAKAFNAPESVLDRLRRRYEQTPEQQTTDIPVPGHGGEFAVRYRVLHESERKKLADDRYGDLDGLIAACVTMLYRNEQGEYEPLTHLGEPLRFDDQHLADMLGLEINVAHPVHGPARQILLGVFKRAPDPLVAAEVHAARLANWTAGGEADREANLAGE